MSTVVDTVKQTQYSRYQTTSNKVPLTKNCVWRLLVHVGNILDVAYLNAIHDKKSIASHYIRFAIDGTETVAI